MKSILFHCYLICVYKWRLILFFQSSATLDLEEPGPYSVELIVHDRAKNYKVARRIILYDNASVVDLYGKQARVVQVQENGWINKHTENIEIVWQNRFRNIRHSNGGWLNGVKETEDIVTDLDDSKGKSARTIDKLNNIDGKICNEPLFLRISIAVNISLQMSHRNSLTTSNFQVIYSDVTLY
jgi:hypothetical protein